MQLPSGNPITLSFGYHANYPLNNGFHKGTDFAYSPDDAVYMPEDGVVQCINWDLKTYEGNVIYIEVANRRHALCHLSKFLVSSGEFVKAGTPIAKMGDTGYTEGKHLHWAIRVDGVLVDGTKLVERKPMSTEEKIQDLYKQLDRTNKNLDNLYKIIDNNLKSLNSKVAQLYSLLDTANKRIDELEKKG